VSQHGEIEVPVTVQMNVVRDEVIVSTSPVPKIPRPVLNSQ
jgi:hypothetical protein